MMRASPGDDEKKEVHELHELTRIILIFFVFFVCFVDHFHGRINMSGNTIFQKSPLAAGGKKCYARSWWADCSNWIIGSLLGQAFKQRPQWLQLW